MELSFMIELGSWGWPVSISAILSSSPFLAFVKSAPISALVDEAMTFLKILQTKRIGSLSGTWRVGGFIGSSGRFERKKCLPALLLAPVSDINEASEWMCSIIPDAVLLAHYAVDFHEHRWVNRLGIEQE
eukprot:15240377-Ditylum_brightwellii.AAC.1